MSWLVKLYPRSWRERYGEEFEALLASQKLSLGMMVDVLGGALDAHLYPQSHVVSTSNDKGDAMTETMMKRCAAGGPKLSRQEQMRAGVGMLVGALVLSVAFVLLKKTFGAVPAVEGLGYALLPATFLFYTQLVYLRRRSWVARFVLTGGAFGFVYLALWGACAVAAGIDVGLRHAS